MTYVDMLEKIRCAFLKLEEEKQAGYVENDCNSYVGVEASIFPMAKFNDFFDKYFKGDLLEFTWVLQRIFRTGNTKQFYPIFDKADKWCYWDEKNKMLYSSDAVIGFVSDDEAFLLGLINSVTLKELGFSDEEIEEIMKCYEAFAAENT